MKLLISIFFMTLSLSVFSQGGGYEGGNVGPKPTNDTKPLIDIIRDSNHPLMNRDRNSIPNPSRPNGLNGNGTGGGHTAPDKFDSEATGGNVLPMAHIDSPRTTTRRTNTTASDLTNMNYTPEQIQEFMNDANNYFARARNNDLPLRLSFESISLTSDEVSEITLKDGSVVKVDELQEFVREKMKQKLQAQE